MEMKTYIGITVGPIYKTMCGARDAGQLWGCSYIFSYIIKEIMKRIYDLEPKRQFITPYVDGELFKKEKESYSHIGIFHDRCIFESQEGDLEKVKEATEEVLELLSRNYSDDAKIKDYINQYFQIYYVEKHIRADEKVFTIMTECLDSLELRQKYISIEEHNYVTSLFKNDNIKDNIDNIPLFIDAFSNKKNTNRGCILLKNEDSRRFISVPEIAIKEFNIDANESNKFIQSGNFYTKLSKYIEEHKIKKKLMKYHKYICIIQSDGDSVTRIMKDINTTEEFEEFSKRLSYFSMGACDAIENYNGVPVYAGGDDLLFFAPIKNEKGETFIDLINKINDCFNEIFKEYINRYESEGPIPSMSYGVSITYYKYPLYEALGRAKSLLFDKAKKYCITVDGQKKEKNATAIKVLKHSGQEFGLTFRNNSVEAGIFTDILKYSIKKSKDQTGEKARIFEQTDDILSNISIEEEKSRILSSVQYSLTKYRIIINKIGTDRKKLDNLFINVFNHDIHKKSDEYIKKIIDLVYGVYSSRKDDTEKAIRFKTVESYLSFIKFMQESGEYDV
ncbi:type III-B CRISPR-associated protein Cas10/Cmr2 [Acetivibrio mesophilus]|uniref:Type III-B CRISPR-associated protein Cas10/Cmr2 n=1 Tax=Acetivibrio mesophilus TaxID=2487273 RepID=A0A4Q0I0P4_9FIRM|nr:type III-B CRISPR-associated protein Cas10/Cmr2 [Acetivibrio mesophilus]RXE57794.1 type III-B CRISPR-associated protein Cas10/Cmr2 [Acetivibrio mesophilus]